MGDVGLCKCGHAREDHNLVAETVKDGSTAEHRTSCKFSTDVYFKGRMVRTVACGCKIYEDLGYLEDPLAEYVDAEQDPL